MLMTPFAEEFSTFRAAGKGKGKSDGSSNSNRIINKYIQTAPPGADGLICTCSS